MLAKRQRVFGGECFCVSGEKQTNKRANKQTTTMKDKRACKPLWSFTSTFKEKRACKLLRIVNSTLDKTSAIVCKLSACLYVSVEINTPRRPSRRLRFVGVGPRAEAGAVAGGFVENKTRSRETNKKAIEAALGSSMVTSRPPPAQRAKLNIVHVGHFSLGGTQTGSHQTGSYQKGRFIPAKPIGKSGFWEQPRLIRPRLYASDSRKRRRVLGGTRCVELNLVSIISIFEFSI